MMNLYPLNFKQIQTFILQSLHKKLNQSQAGLILDGNLSQASEQLTLIPQHIQKLGNRSAVQQQLTQKLISSGKFTRCNQFKSVLHARVVWTNFQSVRIALHYGHFKREISMIYTQIDERILTDLDSKSGSFGTVAFINYQGVKHAAKGIRFQYLEDEIDPTKIYKEYFLCSIADVLGIGPKMVDLFGYDILLAKNMAFFSMEECKPVNLDLRQTAQAELLQNLQVMHSLGFIHLDIKPANTAYSNHYRRHVFLDFGLSRLIKEPPGSKTRTSFLGTLSFCSEQMRKCYFSNKSKLIDLYENDLCCLKNTKKLFYKLKNIKNRDIFEIEKVRSYKYFKQIISIIRLKYFCETQSLQGVLKVLKNTNNSKRIFYEIFKNFQISKFILEDKEVKELLSQMKDKVLNQHYEIDKNEEMIYEVFCEEKRAMSAEKIIPISQILEAQPEVFWKFLSKPDLILKLFHFFHPFSQHNLNQTQNKYQLKKILVDRIYETKQPNFRKPIFFSQKVRFVLLYFYESLKQAKNWKSMIYIRLLLISAQDWSYVTILQNQLISIIDQPFLKLLKTFEFNLFKDTIQNDIRQYTNKKWFKIIQNIPTNQPRAQKMKSLLGLMMAKSDYANESLEFKMSVVNLIKEISELCSSPEQKQSIYLIKHTILELFQLHYTVLSEKPPKGLQLEIYSRFLVTVKIQLTDAERQQLEFFSSLRMESTRSRENTSPQDVLRSTMHNQIQIFKQRNQYIGWIISKILFFDIFDKNYAYDFLKIMGETFSKNESLSVIQIGRNLYTVRYMLDFLNKNQGKARKNQQLQKAQKMALLRELQGIFNKFIQAKNIESTISMSSQLTLVTMILRAQFGFESGKSAEEMQQLILATMRLMQPLLYKCYRIVIYFSLLFGYLQPHLYGYRDHYSKQILVHIAQEYISKKYFYFFQIKKPILGDFIRLKNEQGKQKENFDMIMSLIQDLNNQNQALTGKISAKTFLYIVRIFCATLPAEKLLKIYQLTKTNKLCRQCGFYEYLVFEMFLWVKSDLDKPQQLSQIIRTTLSLKNMKTLTHLKVKSELFRLYKHVVNFKSKRKAYICRKLQMRNTPDKSKTKSHFFIEQLKAKLQKLKHTKIEKVLPKLYQKISTMSKSQFYNFSQILSQINRLYYSHKF